MFISKKNRTEITRPPEAENTLYLYIENKNEDSEYISYCLSQWDMDERDYDFFMPFFCDVTENLFHSLTAVTSFCYSVSEHSEKRKKRSDTLPEFKTDGYTDKILDYIGTHPDCLCRFWNKEHLLKYRRKTKTGKFLYVAKENITARFIKEAYIDTFYETYDHDWFFLSFDGFTPGVFDITRYIGDSDSILPCIRAEYDSSHSALNIDIAKERYPIDKLINKITELTEKHGKKLEVQL